MRKLICLHDENTRIKEERASTASNTRALATVTGKYARLDWVSGTFSYNCHQELVEIIENFFPDGNKQLGAKPVKSYHVATRFEPGVLLSTTADYARSHIAITGNALEWLEESQQHELLSVLAGLGMKATRMDVAVDDYDRELSIGWHREQIAYRKTLCYFRTVKCITNVIEDVDETLYLGRRGASGSGCYFRIYDKNIESKGETNAIRYEAEYSGDKAEQVLGFILDSDVTRTESYGDTITGLVFGCLDYRNKEGKKELDRCTRVPEWETFLQQRVTTRVLKRKGSPRSEFNAAHFIKQYGKTFLVLELQQHDNLSNLLFQCREHARSCGIKKVGNRIIGALPDWAIQGRSGTEQAVDRNNSDAIGVPVPA